MFSQFWQSFKPNWPLLVVLGIYTLLVGIYSWATPPFEGPDEPQHFAYIEWLVKHNDFPPQGKASWDTPVQQESSQPPLYYLLASIPARLSGVENPPAEFRPNPYPIRGFPLNYPDNDNRAIHYPTDAVPLQGGWLALYLARVVTLVFGVLLIIAVYGLARQAVPSQRQVALFCAFFVATIPQVLFISSVVSNDIPVAALGTVTLWMLAGFMREDRSGALAIGIGVTYGLTILSKSSGLALGLPIAVALLWMGLSKRYLWGRVIRIGFLVALGAVFTAGWWFVRSWILFGSLLGLETHDQAPWAIVDPAMLGAPSFRWVEVFRSFWIWLGWGTIRPDNRFYSVFFLMVLVALTGLILVVWRRRKFPQPSPDVTAAIFVMLLSGIAATSFVLEIWMRRVTAPYGRLLFPVIGGLALFLVIGWRAIHPKLPIVPIAATLLTSILAVFLLLKPAYAPPDFLTTEDLAATSTINWMFGESADQPLAELLSVEPQVQTIAAGSLLPVELCWRAMAQTDRDFAVLIHVIGPENTLIANRRTYPGLGRYPTSIWQPGTIWCDLVHILIAEESVPRTLAYKIEIGFLDAETDERLPAFTAGGEPIAATFVKDILISQNDVEDFPPGPGDEILTLLDFKVDSNWRLGQARSLTLTWRIADPLAQDYQQFVHLRDSETGQTVAQADGPPFDGWYPTSRWLPDTIITDMRLFPLGVEIAPGSYDLVVGFYDLASGQRFGPEFFLETVEVQP